MLSAGTFARANIHAHTYRYMHTVTLQSHKTLTTFACATPDHTLTSTAAVASHTLDRIPRPIDGPADTRDVRNSGLRRLTRPNRVRSTRMPQPQEIPPLSFVFVTTKLDHYCECETIQNVVRALWNNGQITREMNTRHSKPSRTRLFVVDSH